VGAVGTLLSSTDCETQNNYDFGSTVSFWTEYKKRMAYIEHF